MGMVLPSRTQSLITVFTAGREEGRKRNATRSARPNSMHPRVVTSLTLEFAHVLAQLAPRVSFCTWNNSRYVRLRFIARSLDFCYSFTYAPRNSLEPRNQLDCHVLLILLKRWLEIIELVKFMRSPPIQSFSANPCNTEFKDQIDESKILDRRDVLFLMDRYFKPELVCVLVLVFPLHDAIADIVTRMMTFS